MIQTNREKIKTFISRSREHSVCHHQDILNNFLKIFIIIVLMSLSHRRLPLKTCLLSVSNQLLAVSNQPIIKLNMLVKVCQ